MKKIVFPLLVILFSSGYLNAQSVNFIDGRWENVKAKAKSENKYLFVDCYTEWCGWCKVLDKNTFSDARVADVMNRNFVSVKIDMEKGYGINLSMKYRVNAFPTGLVFNSEGNLVYRILGYAEPGKYLEILSKAMDPATQYNLKGISDKVDLDFPQFYKDVFATGNARKWPQEKIVTDFLDNQKDLFDEISWAVIKICGGGEKYEQHLFSNIKKYTELYGPEVEDKVSRIMYARLNVAIKNKDEKKFNECLNDVSKYITEDREETLMGFKLEFYSGVKDWKRFAREFQDYIDKNGYTNAGILNSYCWNIYQNCDDQELISKACEWMNKALMNDSQYAFIDTYAALLYKNKQYKEAEITAKLAIETGKKTGENVKSTEDLLVKIKAASGK